MQAGTSDLDFELENNMTSNDSGVESSTDNDDCAQPMFNQRLVSTAEIRTMVPVVRRMRTNDLPMYLNTITEPPIVFARPMLNESSGHKFKCLFELANPTFPGTSERFQSVSMEHPQHSVSVILCCRCIWWVIILWFVFFLLLSSVWLPFRNTLKCCWNWRRMMVLLKPKATLARSASTRVVVKWGQMLFSPEVVYSESIGF